MAGHIEKNLFEENTKTFGEKHGQTLQIPMMFPWPKVYPSSQKSWFTANGCISNRIVTFQILRHVHAIFHLTMSMGERFSLGSLVEQMLLLYIILVV